MSTRFSNAPVPCIADGGAYVVVVRPDAGDTPVMTQDRAWGMAAEYGVGGVGEYGDEWFNKAVDRVRRWVQSRHLGFG
jgi:hypothetical protein